jgi:hypothetical protein
MHRTGIALTAFCIVWFASIAARSQQEASPDVSLNQSQLEVVYEGPERSHGFLDAIAAKVQPDLPAGKKASRPIEMQFVMTPEQMELSQDIKIFTLLVSWPQNLQLTKQEEQAVVDSGRKKIEAELQRMQRIAEQARSQRRGKELAELIKRQESVSKEFDVDVARLGALQDQYFVSSADDIDKQRGQVGSRMRELEIQDAGISARRKAVEERIDRLRHETQTQGENESGIIAELERLMGIRDTQLKQMKALNEAGRTVSAGEVQEAEAALARARIDLLTAKRDAVESASGPALRELNNELSRLVIQAAENQGQRESVREMIRNLPSPDTQLQLSVLQKRSALLRQRLIELGENINKLGEGGASERPATLRPLAAVEAEQKDEKK